MASAHCIAVKRFDDFENTKSSHYSLIFKWQKLIFGLSANQTTGYCSLIFAVENPILRKLFNRKSIRNKKEMS